MLSSSCFSSLHVKSPFPDAFASENGLSKAEEITLLPPPIFTGCQFSFRTHDKETRTPPFPLREFFHFFRPHTSKSQYQFYYNTGVGQKHALCQTFLHETLIPSDDRDKIMLPPSEILYH